MNDGVPGVAVTAAPPPGGIAYPVTRHGRGDDIVALRAGLPISRTAFLRDVAALAALLPDRPYVLNLCADRYRFMVGFAAALCRRQISLLPPADAPAILSAVAEDHPELYSLTDAAAVPAALSAYLCLVYPRHLDHPDRSPAVPAIPDDQPALILFTSGSTGRPVPVPKSWGVLVRSALAAGARLEIARLAGGTIIGTVPHRHSYGLESMILLALQHGLAVDTGGLFYPGDIRSAIEAAARPCLLVTTPVHLRALVEEPDGMPPVDLILSATAPLSAPLAAAAEVCFGAPLIEIYGCTEAGQVATRRTTHDEAWHCLDGVNLNERDGGIWARGAAVEGAALLHDEITPMGPGRFRLGGRSADLVNVAGKRISLAHLNHTLLSIAGVTDGVFFMPDQDGTGVIRLAALVVAPALPTEEVLQALRERIDVAFMPRPLVLLDALPRNELGKLPRRYHDAMYPQCAKAGYGMTPPSVKIHFAVNHPTAAGHFPAQPMIPGALLLDEVLRSFLGAPGYRPTVIRAAKFYRPVCPGESIWVDWQSSAADSVKFECRLADDGALVATGMFEIGLQAA